MTWSSEEEEIQTDWADWKSFMEEMRNHKEKKIALDIVEVAMESIIGRCPTEKHCEVVKSAYLTHLSAPSS